MSAAVRELTVPADALDPDRIDPRQSEVLRREVPGLTAALDSAAMMEQIQDLLIGRSRGIAVERCLPTHALYLPGTGCVLRYELGLTGGEQSTLLVNAYLFSSPARSRRYARERLEPLVEGARARRVLRSVATPVAVHEPLSMCLAVFPVDGELPTLVDAADPERAGRLVRRALVLAGRHVPRAGIRITVCQYARRRRCVLRYELESDGTSGDRPVFGKVTSTGRGALAASAIHRLRTLLAGAEETPFRIPLVFGFYPELELLLLDAAPGTAAFSRTLKAAVRGDPSARRASFEGVEACARIAAALHTSAMRLGPPRPGAAELLDLRASIAGVRRVTPGLGEWLSRALETAEQRMVGSRALPLGASHGDFKHTQILVDEGRPWLLDFDTVCHAEPALDLGQFLACLRLVGVRRRHVSGFQLPDPADELCGWFLDTYCAATGREHLERRELELRVAAYELLSLIRLAIHSWQKFKTDRLSALITLLEELLVCPSP